MFGVRRGRTVGARNVPSVVLSAISLRPMRPSSRFSS